VSVAQERRRHPSLISVGKTALALKKERSMTPEKTINFAARFEYVSAIEVHWPDVMKALQQDVLPDCRGALEIAEPDTALRTWASLSNAVEGGAPSEITRVELAIRTWAEHHGFRDGWLRDVALQTMQTWSRDGITPKWTYLPEELDTPSFRPSFGCWIPAHTKWLEFKRLTDKRYRRELALYRAKVRTLWGEGQPKLSQSAVWTVLWQQGKSPEAIQTHHRRTTGKSVSLANIQLRVRAFANAAGLTLRIGKAGSPAKNITST
jgi:hypothetical protein